MSSSLRRRPRSRKPASLLDHTYRPIIRAVYPSNHSEFRDSFLAHFAHMCGLLVADFINLGTIPPTALEVAHSFSAPAKSKAPRGSSRSKNDDSTEEADSTA